MAALTLTPAIGNYVELSPETAYLVLAAAVGLLFAGAALGLLGSRRARTAGGDHLDEAVARVVAAYAAQERSLPAHTVDLIVLLREAGPGAAAEVAPRLGDALDYVRRVDAHFQGRPIGVPPTGISSTSGDPG